MLCSQLLVAMEIVNTIQFQFPVGSPPPSWAEIAEFMKRLNSDLMQMEAAYKTPQKKSLCVKFKSLEAMEQTLQQNHELLKFRYANGITVDVHMCTAGRNNAYVRVFDLPPEIPDNALSRIFSAYGKVGSIVREKFPAGMGLDHLHNGVRGVYVDIEHEFPPSLEICNWRARIFYEGLKNRCFSCNQEGHRRDSCPQQNTRKLKEKKKKVIASYADMVETGGTVINEEASFIEEISEDQEVEDIIVLEEEHVVTEEQSMEQESKGNEDSERIREKQELERAHRRYMINYAIKGGASERRAQFASTGSTEILRPKKNARKS